jgi:NifU-like protein
MAKSDLIGGSLWEQYSEKVSSRMNDPRHLGEITEEKAKEMGATLVVADWGAEACGDAIRIYWAVDAETNTIRDARFKTFGCGTAIAASDIMAEMCIGRTVDEALKITNLDVEQALRDEENKPAIPPQKMHCSVMAYDVIRKAASQYKGVDMSDIEESDIVCECARVTKKTIQDVIRLNDLKTVEEITQYTKAGAFCKSCIRPGGHETRKYYLVDILQETREEMVRDEIAKNVEQKDFKSMTLIQKHRAIEEVLDQEVRKMLLADGGNVEIVDMKEQDSGTDIYINYTGACAGCPSGKTMTLEAITSTLQNKVDQDIKVHPL